ncbi:MAG: homoserine dehydrogenase, partial [Methanobrevibacter sp.]|nr:homoserine dehydrogenase [Methanobrevibacter sp.]
MDECKVIIMGFGAVGKGVANAISLKKDMIKDKFGITLKVVAAADSSTSAICEDGLDEELLLKTKEETGKLANYPEYGSEKSGIDVLDAVEYDVLIEAT